MQNFMLSCTNEIRYSVTADIMRRFEFMIKPVVENMHSTGTDEENFERLKKAPDTDDVQPLPRIARHPHHSPSQYICYFTARTNREKSEV